MAIRLACQRLRRCTNYEGVNVVMFSDSLTAVEILNLHANCHKCALEAGDMFRDVRDISPRYPITVEHVKGHSGHYYNELVDFLAGLSTGDAKLNREDAQRVAH
eukprot:2900506-Karenia_brevis.AAC.1